MVTRLLLRLPWYLSTPSIVVMAAVGAVVLNLYAGTYFQRSFQNDLDPLAGTTAPVSRAAPVAPAAATPAAGTPGTGYATPAAGTPVAGNATPATGTQRTPVAGNATPATGGGPAAAAPPAPANAPGVLLQGQFQDGEPGHNGKGTARVIRAQDGSLVLRFENFSVTNGPDLRVILSTDPGAGRGSATSGDALDIGGLKATDGNVNYTIPAGTDIAKYRSVIIWCRAFRVLFASAKLEVAQ